MCAPRQRDGSNREPHTRRREWRLDVERVSERAGVRKLKAAAWGRGQQGWEFQEQMCAKSRMAG